MSLKQSTYYISLLSVTCDFGDPIHVQRHSRVNSGFHRSCTSFAVAHYASHVPLVEIVRLSAQQRTATVALTSVVTPSQVPGTYFFGVYIGLVRALRQDRHFYFPHVVRCVKTLESALVDFSSLSVPTFHTGLRSGPCSTVAPHPTAVHIVPGNGIQLSFASGKQTGRIQRLNSKPRSSFNTAKSFSIVDRLYCV